MGSSNGFDLFNRRLYNVSERLQLCQGILRSPSKEGAVNHSIINAVCRTHLALECWVVDVAGCEDRGIGSEMEKDIVNDERRAALKVDGVSHCHYHDLTFLS